MVTVLKSCEKSCFQCGHRRVVQTCANSIYTPFRKDHAENSGVRHITQDP